MIVSISVLSIITVFSLNAFAGASSWGKTSAKATIKSGVDNAPLYDATKGVIKEDSREGKIVNKGRKHNATHYTFKAAPCRGGMAYRLQGYGWVCGDHLNMISSESGNKTKQTRQLGGGSQNDNQMGEQSSSGFSPEKISSDKAKGQKVTTESLDRIMRQKVVEIGVNKKQEVKKSENATGSDRFNAIKDRVEGSEVQAVKPDEMTFVKFSKNFTNRIHCPGKITKVVYPKDRGVKIYDDDNNIFLRVDPDAPSQFVLDLFIQCSGEIFEMNGAVDGSLSSQKIVLDVPKSKSSAQKQQLSKSQEKSIAQAESLPLEDKVSKIFKRAYPKDYMSYWDVHKVDRDVGGFVYMRRVETHINNMVVRDLVKEGKVTDNEVLGFATYVLPKTENLIAYGVAEVPETGANRVILLSVGK